MCPKPVLLLLVGLIVCSAGNDLADEDGQLLSTSLKHFCELQKIKNGSLFSSFYEIKISTRLRPFKYYLCNSDSQNHENLLKEIYSSEFVNDDSVFGSRTLAIREELQVANYSSPAINCPGTESFLVFIDSLIQIKYGYLPRGLLDMKKLAEMLEPVEPLPNNLKIVFRYENSTVFYWKPLVLSSKFVYDTNRIFFDVEASANLEYSLMIPLLDENHRSNSSGCVQTEDLPDSVRDGLKIRKFNGTGEILIAKEETKTYFSLTKKDNNLRKEDLPRSAFQLRSLCGSRKIISGNVSYLVNAYYRLDILYYLDALPEVRDLFDTKAQDTRDALYLRAPYNLTEIKIRRRNFADQFMSLRKRIYSENFIERSSNLTDEFSKARSELETLKTKYLDVESVKTNKTSPLSDENFEPFLIELFHYDELKYFLNKFADFYMSKLESNYLLNDYHYLFSERNLEPFLRLYYPLPSHLESAFRNETSSVFKTKPLVLFDKLEVDSEEIVRYARTERFFKVYFSLFIPMFDRDANFANCIPPKRLPRFFAQN